MYNIKTESGKGFRIEYPKFTGDGYSVVNDFYRRMADTLAEYFGGIVRDDSRCICRCMFSVEDSDTGFTVTVTITRRRAGESRESRVFEHRWRRWEGCEAVLEKENRHCKSL